MGEIVVALLWDQASLSGDARANGRCAAVRWDFVNHLSVYTQIYALDDYSLSLSSKTSLFLLLFHSL